MLTLEDIEEARAALGGLVNETPTHRWRSPLIEARLGAASAAFLKLEVFQLTGTFKVRGALLHALALDGPARERGVTAVSAGNHAIAVAFAAQRIGTSAKVVMMRTANPFRVAQVKAYGAELVQVPDVHAAFETATAIGTTSRARPVASRTSRPSGRGTGTVQVTLSATS